jgi:hypothetical protein
MHVFSLHHFPKTGITLLNNQKGFICSELPVVICTVIVVLVVIAVLLVNIAVRRQLLSRTPPLTNNIGRRWARGGPTRRSVVPLPLPLMETNFQFHHPLALCLPRPP